MVVGGKLHQMRAGRHLSLEEGRLRLGIEADGICGDQGVQRLAGKFFINLENMGATLVR